MVTDRTILYFWYFSKARINYYVKCSKIPGAFIKHYCVRYFGTNVTKTQQNQKKNMITFMKEYSFYRTKRYFLQINKIDKNRRFIRYKISSFNNSVSVDVFRQDGCRNWNRNKLSHLSAFLTRFCKSAGTLSNAYGSHLLIICIVVDFGAQHLHFSGLLMFHFFSATSRTSTLVGKSLVLFILSGEI